MIARPPATSAMRSVLSTGITVCGVSSRMPVNATSALNATRLPGLTAAASRAGDAPRSGRHQIVPASSSLIGLSGHSLLPAHADRAVEQRDVLEAVVAKPAKDFGIEKLPLIFRRVPIERVEPPPVPVGLHRDRRRQLRELADDRHA